MLENSFNKIWRINKKRSLPRRIVDYVAIIFLGPIFFVALSALNSFIIDELIHYFSKQSIFIDLFIAVSGPLTYIILFSFISFSNLSFIYKLSLIQTSAICIKLLSFSPAINFFNNSCSNNYVSYFYIYNMCWSIW